MNPSQLKRTGNKVLLKGGALEDAIAAAITAMNEPKTCSTTILRRYLLDANKDRKQYQLGTSLPSAPMLESSHDYIDGKFLSCGV